MEKLMDFCPECETMSDRRFVERVETLNVRGEPIEVLAAVAHCTNCGAAVEDREADSASLNAAFAEYRRRHHIISAQEIAALRVRLGDISQRALGRLLDWGDITIHRYEAGAMPDGVHNDFLRALQHDETLIEFVTDHLDRLAPRDRKKVEEALRLTRSQLAPRLMLRGLEQAMEQYSAALRGFHHFDFERLGQMIVFFAERQKPGRTKLNKLLWYADFLSFKRCARSLSGTPYLHWTYGPVPERFPSILAEAENQGLVQGTPYFYTADGELREGWEFSSTSSFDASLFTPNELDVLKRVDAEFRHVSAAVIRDRSHGERGWSETQQNEPIPYEYAKYLSLD